MPFVLPTFNLVCNVWFQKDFTVPVPAGPPDLAMVACNLALGKRIAGPQLFTMWLLLPPLTNVFYPNVLVIPNLYDIVEVPAGSLRWYGVESVDDIGKGFANEHRFATLINLSTGIGADPSYTWPRPIP
jgi:hypothetical protein